jgi:hypothetical protein
LSRQISFLDCAAAEPRLLIGLVKRMAPCLPLFCTAADDLTKVPAVALAAWHTLSAPSAFACGPVIAAEEPAVVAEGSASLCGIGFGAA